MNLLSSYSLRLLDKKTLIERIIKIEKYTKMLEKEGTTYVSNSKFLLFSRNEKYTNRI